MQEDRGEYYPGVWRQPAEETTDLYPGLCVHDGRVTGSITIGPTRLPLWAFLPTLIEEDWEAVRENWPTVDGYDWTAQDTARFLNRLMQMRGEFGRLLLVLADVERSDEGEVLGPRWWTRAATRQRIREQLERCLQTLDSENNADVV